MFRIIVLSLAIFFAPCLAAAQTTVESHLFDDLNGNGISDADEEAAQQEQPSEIDDTELPPTPDTAENADPVPADDGGDAAESGS